MARPDMLPAVEVYLKTRMQQLSDRHEASDGMAELSCVLTLCQGLRQQCDLLGSAMPEPAATFKHDPDDVIP